MHSAILSAASGLIGSLLGGVSTFAASWLTTRTQYRAQTLVQHAVKRDALYAEFASEAARRLAEAWTHQGAEPEVIAVLWGAVARMRLTSSQAVIKAAEEVVYHVLDAYAAPNHTLDDLRHLAQSTSDPLRVFSEACRAELLAAGD